MIYALLDVIGFIVAASVGGGIAWLEDRNSRRRIWSQPGDTGAEWRLREVGKRP